jgi:dTDP-L-rhamnose 4-epimerase
MTVQRILITGGAGFIGSSLALRLVDRGHSVRVLDTLAPQIHGPNPEASPLYRSIVGKVEFIRGSVTIRSDLIRALHDIDTVVHLAAETGTGQSMYAIQHYSDVNIGGTALMLDLIANTPFPIRKIVVASSRAVYGEGKYECPVHETVYPSSRSRVAMECGDFELHCPLCGSVLKMLATDEDSALSPISVYGVTKLTQEQLVLTVGRALGISAVAFRYQNVYGPGQSLTNPYTGILSIFSSRIRHGSPINIFEDGTESRDFVYIDDVVAATLSGVEHEDTTVNVFNVGSGTATDVTTVVRKLQELLGRMVQVTTSGQFRVGDIRHNVANLTKIREVFGFHPRVSIDDGLTRFAQWVMGEALQIDRYEESLREMRAKGLFR